MAFLLAAGCATPPPAAKTPAAPQPFSFGVITDVQYGDKDVKPPKNCRGTLAALAAATTNLNARDLAFVVHLGDIVDGYANDAARSEAEMDLVLDGFQRVKAPVRYALGNHCVFAGTNALHRKLGLASFYYDFTVPQGPGWRFVVLNGNEGGYGGIGTNQVRWLAGTLDRAARSNENVVIFCHFPLLQPGGRSFVRKPEEVRALVEKSGRVKAWFAGHDHKGAYTTTNGVHYVTVKGVVENAATGAYGVIDVLPDRLVEHGFGAEPSREMPLGR